MVHAVEKAIMAANLGLNPSTEGQVLRLRIPELNEERRKDLVKVAHKYAEAARVAVRHVRRDGLDVLKKLEKDHKISEDDDKRSSEQVQKATDEMIAEIDQTARHQGKGNPHGVRLDRAMSKTEPLRTAAIGDLAVPRHVAIIMDGNGRWAAARGLPRGEGHRRGVEALRRTVRAAGDLGIGSPDDLLLQLGELVAPAGGNPRTDAAAAALHPQRSRRAASRTACACASSASAKISIRDIRRLLEEAEELTRGNDKLILVVAFNYGARARRSRAPRSAWRQPLRPAIWR